MRLGGLTRESVDRHCKMRDAKRRHRGYALLLTLILLTLTAVTISSLAHLSSSQALQSLQADRDLQTRWAELSCRRVLIPALQVQLEADLERWRQSDPQYGTAEDMPASSVTTTIDFHGIRVVARLDDQQALPNLNDLLSTRHNGQPSHAKINAIIARTSIRERLAPLPLDDATSRRLGTQPYTAWGQLFPSSTPETLSGININSISGGMPLTLWGDGRLNLWTATPQSLHLVLDDRIGSDKVAKLLALRLEHRDLSARELIQMLNLGPSQRAAARLELTDQSKTYALWLSSPGTPPGNTSGITRGSNRGSFPSGGKPSTAYTIHDPDRSMQWVLIISERTGNSSLGSSRSASQTQLPGVGNRVFRW